MKLGDFHGKKYDFHGKTPEFLEQEIDKLSMSGEVVEIVVGNGRGVLKEKFYELLKTYKFRIASQSANGASFVVDFTYDHDHED
jgi:dsDNA-specific endonuclease/ATPase MutS2